MGSALASQLASSASLILFDRHHDKAKALAKELKCTAAADLHKAIEQAKIILLAIKPKDLKDFATSVQLSKNHLLISILGATPLSHLRQLFPHPAIVRALPNLAVQCGKGVVGLSAENESHRAEVETLFKGLGLLLWLSEPQLEALSAIAGSGPAFIFVLIEAMMESGVYLGFKPDQALALVLQTMEGAIALLKTSHKHPAELKLQVASPGGTTIAGLKALEESGMRGHLMNVFLATFLKRPLS
jgi:pyrroline-5-carboxylate reductase